MSQENPILPDSGNRGKIARVDVVGKSHQLWAKLQTQLYDKITQLLDFTLDYQSGNTVKDELKEFTTALLDYGKAKLQMPVVEVQKIEAEIAEIYAEKRVKLAEARKLDAEARNIEFQNRIKELRLTLGAAKAFLIGKKNKKALMLGERITVFLDVLKELKEA
jgi:hypothetical protein